MPETKKNNKIPKVVWLIITTQLLLLVVYSLIFPQFRGPDEPHHIDIIRTITLGNAYPAWDQGFIHQDVSSALGEVRFSERSKNLLAAEATARSQRPSFEELGEHVTTEAINQISSHPQLYYRALSFFNIAIRALPGTLQWDVETSFLRLMNILLVSAVGLFGYLTARTLRLGRSVALLTALSPLAIPQLMHIGSTVNNDNLIIFFFAVLTWLLARVLVGDKSKKTALLIGLVTGAAMLTKGFGLIAPIWVLFVYLSVVKKFNWRVAFSNLTLAGIVSLSGAWWWIRNVIVFNKLQPAPSLLEAQPGFEPDFGYWVPLYFDWMSRRFWGWFGWFDFELPEHFAVVASAFVISLALLAIIFSSKRIKLLLLSIPIVGLLLVSIYFAGRGYIHTGVTPAIQGRYLFGAVIPSAIVTAVGFTTLLGKRYKVWAPLILFILAVIMNVFAITRSASFYWGSLEEGFTSSFQAIVAWSPWPVPILLSIAIIFIVVIVLTFVALIKEGLSQKLSPRKEISG